MVAAKIGGGEIIIAVIEKASDEILPKFYSKFVFSLVRQFSLPFPESL